MQKTRGTLLPLYEGVTTARMARLTRGREFRQALQQIASRAGMRSVILGLIVFPCIFGAALLGMLLRAARITS
jgi:hypothetical protein